MTSIDVTAVEVPLTVPALVARNATLFSGRDAVVTHHSSITHDELEHASRLVAGRLIEAGMEPGIRVGLLAENGVEWAILAVAVMRTGAVLVPLSTLLRVPELTTQLEVAEVRILVSTAQFRGRQLHDEAMQAAAPLHSAPAVLRMDALVEPDAKSGVAPDARPDAPPGVPVEPDRLVAMEAGVEPGDDLVVLFTSGSRGLPKGVIHTHSSAVLSVRAGLEARCVGPDDRLYLPMPMFWTGGFSMGLFTTLVVGNTMLTEAEPEPSATLALLERERATLFRGWPDQAARLAAHKDRDRFDLANLRDASLPAMLPPDRRPAPGARPNLLGMTESFGPYCGERLDIDLPRELWGCCGRPFSGVEVRAVDPDTGRDCRSGEPGELWLRGPTLLRGICGRENSDVFTPDGWFRTGDLGFIDSGGHIWYTGRLDDMFKVSGASVYPSEVEAALRGLTGVREAHVTDVPGPTGPRVAALVVVEPIPGDDTAADHTSADNTAGDSTAGDSTATGRTVVRGTVESTLTAEARERLSAFKVPTRWVITEDPVVVPRTSTAKVDVVRLRALLDDSVTRTAADGPDRGTTR